MKRIHVPSNCRSLDTRQAQLRALLFLSLAKSKVLRPRLPTANWLSAVRPHIPKPKFLQESESSKPNRLPWLTASEKRIPHAGHAPTHNSICDDEALTYFLTEWE